MTNGNWPEARLRPANRMEKGLIDPRRVDVPCATLSVAVTLVIKSSVWLSHHKAEPFTSRRCTRNHVSEDTTQKPKGGVTRVQRPSFTIARNEEFAPCRMFGPKVTSGPLKMSLYF